MPPTVAAAAAAEVPSAQPLLQSRRPAPPSPPPLLRSALLLLFGSISSHLLCRFHALPPSLPWFLAALRTSLFPILLLPFLLSPRPALLRPSLLAAALALGVLSALAYPFPSAFSLPFTALFSFLVIPRATPDIYSLNAVVLLTLAAALASGPYSPRPLPLLLRAAFHGALLPCVELAFARSGSDRTGRGSLIQFQSAFAAASTAAATVGMIVGGEIDAVGKEVAGSGMWCAAMAASGLMAVVGSLGVVYYSSALSGAVLVGVAWPIGGAAAAIAFGGSFSGEKVVAVGLATWGLASYLCGKYCNELAGEE